MVEHVGHLKLQGRLLNIFEAGEYDGSRRLFLGRLFVVQFALRLVVLARGGLREREDRMGDSGQDDVMSAMQCHNPSLYGYRIALPAREYSVFS